VSNIGASIGGHQSPAMKTDVWLTPPDILARLGEFDLDPCAAPEPRPWATAKHMITLPEDGLVAPWEGRCWLNPPYGNLGWPWLERGAEHGNAVALIFARTETSGFFRTVWQKADAVLFVEGRLYFHHADGTRAGANSGGPSCLVAYGENNVSILRDCGIPGAFVSHWRTQ
jgi:hypothetical protein